MKVCYFVDCILRGQSRQLLQHRLCELCKPVILADSTSLRKRDTDYVLLANELVDLTMAQQLFTFVTAPPVTLPNGQIQPVAGTNNEAERTLRPVAEARKTGRTSKTSNGARRQTILTSVLQSLRQYLPKFTLATVSSEIQNWVVKGQSCFERYLKKFKIPWPEASYLDQLFPDPRSPSA